MVRKGDILISWSATLDVFIWKGDEAWLNQHIFKVVFNKIDIDKEFFFYLIKYLLDDMRKQVHGATMKHITKQRFDSLQIPLPPLEVQRKIAAILDAADGLRRKDQELIRQYDALAQAIFIDMFGDPVKNEKGWEVRRIGDVAEVITGSTPPTKEDGMFGGNIPFITPGDLESDRSVNRHLTEAGATKSRMVPKGSTLICCIGATIGKVGIAERDSCFNQQINACIWDKGRMNSFFGFMLFRLIKPVIIAKGDTSTTLPILNKSNFSAIDIVVPPKSLQDDFENHFRIVREGRNLQTEQSQVSDTLFHSLLQRAFKGDLVQA